MGNKHGFHWISPKKRMALYFRGGFACYICRKTVLDGITMTLDHIVSRNNGGTNHHTNLAPCCQSCNSKKNDSPVEAISIDTLALIEQVNADFTQFLPLAEDLIKSNDCFQDAVLEGTRLYLSVCV